MFGEDCWCKTGDRGGDSGEGVSVDELVSVMGMSVGGDGACNRGDVVVSGGGNVDVGGE